MSIHRLHRLPLLCVLILCLLTSPVSSFGYVWCLSADGHAELEEARDGDCGLAAPAPAADGLPALTLDAGTDDCGPCLDVSPSLQWGSARGRDGGTHIALPAPLAAGFVATLDHPVRPLLTNGLIPEASPRIAEPLLQHRTIVLLI